MISFIYRNNCTFRHNKKYVTLCEICNVFLNDAKFIKEFMQFRRHGVDHQTGQSLL